MKYEITIRERIGEHTHYLHERVEHDDLPTLLQLLHRKYKRSWWDSIKTKYKNEVK